MGDAFTLPDIDKIVGHDCTGETWLKGGERRIYLYLIVSNTWFEQ